MGFLGAAFAYALGGGFQLSSSSLSSSSKADIFGFPPIAGKPAGFAAGGLPIDGRGFTADFFPQSLSLELSFSSES